MIMNNHKRGMSIEKKLHFGLSFSQVKSFSICTLEYQQTLLLSLAVTFTLLYQTGKKKMSNEFKVIRLTAEHIPGAVEVLRQSFFPEEKVCCSVHILEESKDVPNKTKYKTTVASNELEALAVDTVKDGVSFVAVDTRTNEVLGVAFNKVQVKAPPGELSYFEKFAKDHIKEPQSIALVDFMVQVDGQYDLFKNYDTNCYFEIMFLSVKSTSKGRGIGTALVTTSAKLAQDLKTKNEGKDKSIDVASDAKENKNSPALKLIPKCVSAIFTSRFSQKCGQRSGFTEVLKSPYTEFTYNGRKYSDVIGPDHPHSALSVKKLN